MPADVDDFDRDPMVLNLSDFCQPDIDARTPVVQPQTDLDEIAGRQLIGRRHLGSGFIDSQHAAVGLELLMDSREHTVDRQVGNGPAALRFSKCHSVKTG